MPGVVDKQRETRHCLPFARHSSDTRRCVVSISDSNPHFSNDFFQLGPGVL